MRATVRALRFFASAHSHTRGPRQAALRKVRVTSGSRSLFRESFAAQNAARAFGIVACRGHP